MIQDGIISKGRGGEGRHLLLRLSLISLQVLSGNLGIFWGGGGRDAPEEALAGLTPSFTAKEEAPPPLEFAAFVSPNWFSDQLKSYRVLKGNSAFSNKQRQRTNGRESFSKFLGIISSCCDTKFTWIKTTS